jgi:hypothetical protein
LSSAASLPRANNFLHPLPGFRKIIAALSQSGAKPSGMQYQKSLFQTEDRERGL